MAELDRVELACWIDVSTLQTLVPSSIGIQGTLDISTPSATQEEASEGFEEFEVEAVAGQKYIE